MADKADNNLDLNCPACGKPMKKVYLPKIDIHLDVCTNGCGGIYFDTREFKKVDEQHEDITVLTEILDNKEFKKVDENKTRICPVCNNIMVKNFSSAKHQIQVDDCYHCGGKFLDHLELERIRAEYLTEHERAQDVIKEYNDKYGHIQLDLREKFVPPENIDDEEEFIPDYEPNVIEYSPINLENEIYEEKPRITLNSIIQYILFNIYSKK